MPSLQEMDIDGHRIVAQCFNEEKDGVPIVFIHGLTTSINFWSVVQIPVITEKFRWYSLSLPGHYPAVFPQGFCKEELTGDMITKVLTEAIHELTDGRPAVLIGHSTGGCSALSIAEYAPEIVHSVVSISGFAKGKMTGVFGLLGWLAQHGAITEAIFKADLRVLVSKRSIYRVGIGIFASDKKALYAHPDLEKSLDVLYPDATRLDVDSMACYFKRIPDIDISERLSRITAPTLALAGTNDPILSPKQSSLIADKVPDCELVLLDGAGHLPMVERESQYRQTITNWLDTVM